MTELLEVGAERAEDVLSVIHQAFASRPVLDPPATALDETLESVTAALAAHGGLLAIHDGRPVGTLIFAEQGELLGLRRVGVLVEARRHGIASLLAERAESVARQRDLAGLALEARAELPRTVGFWEGHGYVEVDRDGPRLHLRRLLPISTRLPTPEDTQAVGRRLGAQLRAGDLLILTGDLGAGKTTFTQGLGEGLGVRGPITSPTFVIARVHPSVAGGPALVHVDAYRLGDAAELDDLDLDTDLDEAVTVVEWGAGLAETLSADRLELALTRAADDVRTLTITPIGARWADAPLATLG
ncbi:tRNA (adenosine(37)-N6)-threonylcarbamoyltransferase complex ATPase subunit type 1 TsaE [Nocardioides marmoriginsengisoli]|uniref:tRNA threonylcarbamoyladenosine biosynthesis protein TsaE n=1 Tax=Nocardioides marmoriginsengisoli TaxID=661483 RepID=A0A3N0CCN7_9ACTN|nr:tRNA (adenosine(37)-N6)-threonylcarbamoyltransferase complex ATPase subunit type 1 TsaE [Nocardioides marmoriginsengisoli]RNL61217.1 tRNA (adenosine(37)-N6)-threonylcarbamoyltransferase complex ATPase subunit type 1 TsaE [Nocardioides marmoriginsengisoli]